MCLQLEILLKLGWKEIEIQFGFQGILGPGMPITRRGELGSIESSQYLYNAQPFCGSAQRSHWEQIQRVEAEITAGKHSCRSREHSRTEEKNQPWLSDVVKMSFLSCFLLCPTGVAWLGSEVSVIYYPYFTFKCPRESLNLLSVHIFAKENEVVFWQAEWQWWCEWQHQAPENV